MANASCVYTALIYDGSGQHEFEMQSPTEFAPRFLPPPFLEPDVGMFPMIPMPLGSAGHISNLGIPIPQYHHQLSHFASHNHVLSPVFPLPDVVVADQQPASNSTRTETLSTFRDAEAADALLSAAVHRHSVLVHLPDDYAQTLYPSVPKGLLPPPDQLRALINAYFSHQLDKIHRPTFEARVCRGEDLARAGYRDAMRSRREFWASGGTDDQSRPVTVQWRETDAVEAHMDPVLLVSVLWTGSSILQSLAERDGDDSVIEIAAKLDPTVWEEMKSWLDSENKEFVGWFGLEDVPGLQRLREEMMGRDPGQLWDGDQHGSSQPKTLPFVGQHLSPAEKYLHAHLMHTFHRDIFDAALSFSISLWATFQLGRLRQTFGAAALLSRVFNMMRCHESVPRAHADDRDRPAVWIRDEEKLRMFSQVLTGEVLFREVWTSFASQTQRTQMSTNFMPLQERLFDDLEVPCNELLFNSLPAAIEAYQDGRHGTQVPTTYSLYLQSPSGHPRWTATRRDVGFWLDLPRTAPQRIASLKLGFGRILDLGAWALAMGVAELMRTFHRLCTWFGEQGVEVHSLAAVGGREEVGPEVREQAAALRLSFIEALDDVTDNLPEALKEAYTTGDGSAMKKLGVMYFGTPGWPTLVSWMCWLHVLHILVRSPQDYIHALSNPDEPWLRSPDFVTCNFHAILVSRLLQSILHENNNNISQVPIFLPIAVLRAGWIHALSLHTISARQPVSDEDHDSVIRLLVEDTAACMRMLRLAGVIWKHTERVHKVFERMVVCGVGPTQGELDELRELNWFGNSPETRRSNS